MSQSSTEPTGWARLRAVWRSVFSLSWPVMAEQVLRTLMRTTDVIVADYRWRNLVLGTVYYRRGWIERGTRMMRERGSLDAAGDE